jgi:hypothetical protein
MIIVTGTKRSGTSLWMQILGAAGLPVLGEAFPLAWESSLADANPQGFYESILREGIHWKTNPHPDSGAFFHPGEVTRHAVKVFIPGLARTDLAYIGRVIATVRHWRDYCASVEALHDLEDAHRGELPPVVRPIPWLEWWYENFTLLRDIVLRRYPVHAHSYDRLLARPREVIARVLPWLELEDLDLEAAVAVVRAREPAPSRPEVDVEPRFAAVFDALFDAVDQGAGLPMRLIATLNETNDALRPRLDADRRRVEEGRARRRSPQ